jgi:Mrp family chromosome partitioning ATPase
MGAYASESGDATRSRRRPGQPPSELLQPSGRGPNDRIAPGQPGLPREINRPPSKRRTTILPATREGLFEPADVQWVPMEVLSACGAALRRIREETIQALAVTSSVRGEGRTTISLGSALAQRNQFGRRTIVLELDLDRPRFAERLGLGPSAGIANILRGDKALEDCILWASPHLGVLHAGDLTEDPAVAYSRFRASSILQDLENAGYAVVADLPPLPPYGLADRIVDMFSAVLMVVRAGTTPVPVVTAAVETLTEPPLLIFNRKKSAIPRWLRAALGR